MSYHVYSECALNALLHDASEAYISDVSAPVKPLLHGYKQIENNLKSKIFERFKVYDFDSWQIDEIDKRILIDEMEQLMPNQPGSWGHKLEKLNIKLWLLTPEKAEYEFIKRFEELWNR